MIDCAGKGIVPTEARSCKQLERYPWQMGGVGKSDDGDRREMECGNGSRSDLFQVEV